MSPGAAESDPRGAERDDEAREARRTPSIYPAAFHGISDTCGNMGVEI